MLFIKNILELIILFFYFKLLFKPTKVINKNETRTELRLSRAVLGVWNKFSYELLQIIFFIYFYIFDINTLMSKMDIH